jgi:hypothetical protein
VAYSVGVSALHVNDWTLMAALLAAVGQECLTVTIRPVMPSDPQILSRPIAMPDPELCHASVLPIRQVRMLAQGVWRHVSLNQRLDPADYGLPIVGRAMLCGRLDF